MKLFVEYDHMEKQCKNTPKINIDLHINYGWRGYDGLLDIGHDKHFQVNHSNNEFAN